MNSTNSIAASTSREIPKNTINEFKKSMFLTIKKTEKTINKTLRIIRTPLIRGFLKMFKTEVVIWMTARAILPIPQIKHICFISIFINRKIKPNPANRNEPIAFCMLLNLIANFNVKNSVSPINPIDNMMRAINILL